MTEKHLNIMTGLMGHYKDTLEHFSENQIVGLFLQGSQNYHIDDETSDIDTKLLVVPSLKDLAYNKNPISHTLVRENNEHIDFKDIRLYMDMFRKQNINFVEILFTDYYVVNPTYKRLWQKLVNNRELIGRYNPYQAIMCIAGNALEKYKRLSWCYPSREEIVLKYGYDPKQLTHLLRFEDFLERYIAEEPYEDCIIPKNLEKLCEAKKGIYSLDEATKMADAAFIHITKMRDDFCLTHDNKRNLLVEDLFQSVQYDMIKIAVKEELDQ